MLHTPIIDYSLILLLVWGTTSSGQAQESRDYPITPITFSQVKLTDDFWSSRIKINHDVTIPIAIQQSEETGRIDNFRKAAGLMPGPFGTKYPFDDSDVFKLLEAASYSLQHYPDPKMEAMLDNLIDIISKAQEPDGYLFTNRTIKEGKPHEWIGDTRWQYVNELSHELYNHGHLFEAAAAHYMATGKTTLLNVALKAADLICETFGPGKLENYPGHQEIEIGLVKLYRITGKKKYLDLAKYFLDVRGKEGVGRPDKYNQSHKRVTEQTEAVGHSVRASYMWTAMADVAAITGNDEYVKAINTLWKDVIHTKYYINGGIGSTSSHEGFGAPYELPNMTAYNETCAGVGNATWNHRMFLMTGDSKYIDVLERTMYNNIVTGVSCSGDRFFYPNPLSSTGQHARSAWFGCACCPPNVARFLPSMPGYIYAQRDNDAYVNLYISSKTTLNLKNGPLTILQRSGLPWEGSVKIVVSSAESTEANLKLRIPGWAQGKPTPGPLYNYVNTQPLLSSLRLNGKTLDPERDAMGYITLSGSWQDGDTIEIMFDLEPQVVLANALVEADKDRIAIERGPLLYCAEWPDNGSVQNIVVDKSPKLTAHFDQDFFDGIVTITTEARTASLSTSGAVQLSEYRPLKLIPYYLWNNRGPGEMSVWLSTTIESTTPSLQQN